ncbi:unnamed protein product [Closterium sp. NIES-54]
MGTHRVLRFDAEGRPLEFSVWLLRAQHLVESQVQVDESLWAHASGDLRAPPNPDSLGVVATTADRDRVARQRAALIAWRSRDAAACIALSSLLPKYEETHFTQVCTASEFLTAIKARYATPTTVSLGCVRLPFLFHDLASFECSADLISHPSSLDSSYRAACTDAPSASASGAVPSPLIHGCTVPQLPTFTASLTTAATDLTAAAVTTSAWSRAQSGRRGGLGAGGSGGGGGGVASGSGGSAGVGGAPSAASSDSPTAASGGAARVSRAPARLSATCAGVAAWYLAQRQQQQQQPLLSQRPQQQQWQQQRSGPRQLLRGDAHPSCPYIIQTGTRSGFRCDRRHLPGRADAVAAAPPPLACAVMVPVRAAAPVDPPLPSPTAAAAAPVASTGTPALPSLAAVVTPKLSPAMSVTALVAAGGTPALPSPGVAVTPPLLSHAVTATAPAAALVTPPLLSPAAAATAPATAVVTPPLLSPVAAVTLPLLSPAAATETAAAAVVPSQTAPAPPSPNGGDAAHGSGNIHCAM